MAAENVYVRKDGEGHIPEIFLPSATLDFVARHFNHDRSRGSVGVKTTAGGRLFMVLPLDTVLSQLRGLCNLEGNGSEAAPFILRVEQTGRSAHEAPPALMSQVDYLQVPMNDIMYQGGLTSSGNNTDPRMFKLTRWELDHDEIQRFLTTSLGGKTIRPTAMPSQSEQILTSEAETNDVFHHSACVRINNVYKANRVPLCFKLNPASQPDPLYPDWVFGDPMMLSIEEPSSDVMAGEGKFPSVLDVGKLLYAVLTLRRSMDQGVRAPPGLRQSQGCAVEQECNYMKSRKARYGFLTCHRYTYFLKYMGPDQYAMTDPYLATRTDPSVPAILYYLCEKSRAEGPVKDKEASAVAAAAHAGSSGQAAGSADPGCSGSPPAKVPRRSGGVQGRNQPSGDPPAAATCISTPCMIPDGALILGDRLGEGLSGTVRLARLFGQEVALKRVDACNASHLIAHLQREAAVLSGPLQSLQGVCVPILHAHGHCCGGLVAVLATSVIYGRHPKAGQESASAKASAEQALQEIHARGVAHGDICEENILVDDDDKVWFIDFGSSVLDPAMHVRTMELEQLRLIFTASSSPNSDKTAHKHY